MWHSINGLKSKNFREVRTKWCPNSDRNAQQTFESLALAAWEKQPLGGLYDQLIMDANSEE